MPLTRREFMKAGAAAGAALLVARPQDVFGAISGPLAFPTSRTSRLFPGDGTFVVHSDLHNHTLLSDGATPAEEAFSLMRKAELDVAALTDHAIMGKVAGHVCGSGPCTFYVGINDPSWEKMRELADAAHVDGSYVAMRGFEWSSATIGHMNVWFTEKWIDTLVTMAQSYKGIEALFGVAPEPGPQLQQQLAPLFAELPETAIIELFYEWLQAPPDREVLGGGSDGLAGFNHPNEYGDFEDFRFVPGLVDRVVSCEALNKDRDFLFWGRDDGMPSGVNACLNAGWRVGLLGVSDEHEDKWGQDRGRGGLWVSSLTRQGVRDALYDRRMYATFEKGLRLDAAANGVQMGRSLGHRSGPVRFDLDIDMGPAGYGRPLRVQLVRPGDGDPELEHEQEIRLPPPSEPVVSFTMPIDVADGGWAVFRVTDPAQAAYEGTPDPFKAAGRAIAYASPFWFDPDAPVGTAAPAVNAAATEVKGQTLAATGGSSAAVAAAGAVAAAAALGLRRLGHHEHAPDE